jgi:hypothetical protein
MHCHIAKLLSDQVEKKLRDFREFQNDQRKRTEDTVKRSQRNKLGAIEKVVKCKRTYETKHKESVKVEEELAAQVRY